jgi:hypothetical protein
MRRRVFCYADNIDITSYSMEGVREAIKTVEE